MTSSVAGSSAVRAVSYELRSTGPFIWNAKSGNAAESFRRLRTKVFQVPKPAVRVVVVSSAIPEDGKTFASVNLALAAAETNAERVILVEADLRRPRIANLIEPSPKRGLAQVLSEGASLEDCVLRLEKPRLDVLTAGAVVPEPTAMLGGSQAKALFNALRERYDIVVLDAPPVLPVADAELLVRHADGVLMVVRHQHTPCAALMDAVELLSSHRLLGLFLNDFRPNLLDRRYSTDKYYRYYRKGPD